ncbi:MAG TPA: HypC/HybG/HupF family hydrogenase formation chaperone [Halieaceae bacterium]|nr:HypC/HybG/HupF family hydrogenase formation chaperone [Halieaceae bacterium]
MCLAVPGRVEAILVEEPLARLGRVDFGGVSREVNLSFTPEAAVGSYVLTHVGFAIACIDEDEAAQVLAALAAATGETP